jgi:DNA polymerase-3 subunit alpha
MIKMTSDGYRSIIERAIQIAELPQSISIHTAGVVVSEEVSDLPLILKDGERVIPFSKNGKQIERLGFIKFDFLSSSVLDIVMNTQEILGREITIPLNDQPSFEMIGSENSYGLFQIKSQGIKEIARKIKPKNLNDVMDVLALGRPGPKDEINAYIKNREQKNYALSDLQGKRLEETRVLSDKLERTYGILIYQEQIMEVSEEWAGFSKEESDSFRVAVSSKDKKIMEEQKSKFIIKSKEKNRDEQTTIEVFKIIEKFASYGFGKSHAAGYAIRTYETAYLKKHHTQEFMIALANASLDKSEKIASVLKEMKRLKLSIDKPNLQNVSILFQKDGDKILYSLVAIKGIGFSDAIKIEKLNLKKMKTAKDFLEVVGIDKRVKETLIKAGIVDNLGDRWMLLSSLRRDKEEYQENKNEKERKVIYKKWENELIRL